MKLGKTLIVVGLIAAGLLSLNFQAWAGNPPEEGANIQGNEYWGVLILACTNNEVTVRVKRVVDCVVETDSLIEIYPLPICPTGDDAVDITPDQMVGHWFGYDGVFFGESGVPIITKVKNLHKKVYDFGGYTGDIYSADVQIRFCTNCASSNP